MVRLPAKDRVTFVDILSSMPFEYTSQLFTMASPLSHDRNNGHHSRVLHCSGARSLIHGYGVVLTTEIGEVQA